MTGEKVASGTTFVRKRKWLANWKIDVDLCISYKDKLVN
jgi:hypothetical protein